MLAIFLVVVFLLQTGAWSLGLMIDRRWVNVAVSSKRKSAHSTIRDRDRR